MGPFKCFEETGGFAYYFVALALFITVSEQLKIGGISPFPQSFEPASPPTSTGEGCSERYIRQET